jgi:hypothetical protein
MAIFSECSFVPPFSYLPSSETAVDSTSVIFVMPEKASLGHRIEAILPIPRISGPSPTLLAFA